jgi:hypothetical protein
MTKMFIKTIAITLDYSPITWDEDTYNRLIDNNTVVGYLLSNKNKTTMSLNLYLVPPNSFYEGNLASIKLTFAELKAAFLQWLDLIVTDPNSFQFRNPPLDLWLETRLNWINALCLKVHQKYGTDIGEALSTAYTTILKLHGKGNVYIGNLHYLKIAIYTSINKEHYYMKNRLTGGHKDAIHLDASPGDFSLSIENDVTDFHEILMMPTWVTEEEKRYDEIWDKMKEDLKEEFSEREIEQICKGSGYMPPSLYRRLLAWRKNHTMEDYL